VGAFLKRNSEKNDRLQTSSSQMGMKVEWFDLRKIVTNADFAILGINFYLFDAIQGKSFLHAILPVFSIYAVNPKCGPRGLLSHNVSLRCKK